MTEIIGDMTLMIISSITSRIALFAFFMTVLKYVSRKLAKTGNGIFKKADKALMKTHKFFGLTMLIFSILHGITSVYSIKMIGMVPFIIGMVCFAACLIAIGSFYLRKRMDKPKHWIFIHRAATVIALVTLIGHIAIAKEIIPGFV